MSDERDDLLLDWLNGHLSPDQAQQLEDALTNDPTLRLQHEGLGQIFSALATPEPATAPRDGRARLFAALDDEPPYAHFTSRIARLLDLPWDPALDYLRKLDDPQVWEPGPAPGVQLFHITGGPRVAQSITGFVRIEAGTPFPEHEHVGEERVLLMRGTLIDSEQGTLRPGALAIMPPDTAHHIAAGPEEELLYLTVIDRGVRIGDMFIGHDDPAM